MLQLIFSLLVFHTQLDRTLLRQVVPLLVSLFVLGVLIRLLNDFSRLALTVEGDGAGVKTTAALLSVALMLTVAHVLGILWEHL